MTLLAVVLAACTTVAGLVVLLAWAVGALPGPDQALPSSTGLWTKHVDVRAHVTRADGVRLAVGLFLGAAVTAYTGWPLMLGLVPLAVVGLPRLLSEPPHVAIDQLQALDRWVRAMTATMATGKSITDALRLSARQAPPLLHPHLVLLVRRLDDRWTPAQALLGLADELDSPDADAVIASLILAADRGGTGATATLAALADTIADRLKAMREIEAERAKPRIVVRQVTGITVVVLALAFLFGREFFAPYGTPLGQAILAALLASYVASLAFLRRLTLPRRRERILRSQP